ncbi:hypothetical protein LX32DRAFT_716813 [Colletotrichum zoysiae]|uniref:Uncharacterized protein n=1 Tax=Colletotrichum zoysiae TaxID=1216348 RepID=A0AAD9H2V1_9PEZI|nr:hypothetical protein LX32DRAFT_716813 [Colletotrichum zoysiae]
MPTVPSPPATDTLPPILAHFPPDFPAPGLSLAGQLNNRTPYTPTAAIPHLPTPSPAASTVHCLLLLRLFAPTCRSATDGCTESGWAEYSPPPTTTTTHQQLHHTPSPLIDNLFPIGSGLDRALDNGHAFIRGVDTELISQRPN